MNWGRRILRVCGLWLALVAVLALAGCSGDHTGAGTVTPDVSASAVPSPIVTVTPPALPSAKPTPASAVAFVRYFWEAYNYAYQTYDTGPLIAISRSSCTYCSSSVDDIKRVQRAKTLIKGYAVKVVEAASPPVEITTGTVVVAACSQAPGRSVYPDGQSSALPGFKPSNFTFALQWNNSHWLVEGIDYEEK